MLLGQGDALLSHDELIVPVHAMEADACICECPEGFDLNDAGSACERSAEAEAVLNGELLEVCEVMT